MEINQIQICHLTKQFKNVKALDDLSLDFTSGRYGLLGPNGAGKTTLLRCITGYYPKYKGQIQFSRQVEQDPGFIGYMPQSLDFVENLSCYENLKLIAYMKNIPETAQDERIFALLNQVHLAEKTKERYKNLSGGMKKRLGIAATYLGEPPILIFDEPTSGLDPEERMHFSSYLQKAKPKELLIISTHIVSDVEQSCDFVVIMNHGKVVYSGKIKDLMLRYEGKIYRIEEEKWNVLNPKNCKYIRTEHLENKDYVRYFLPVPDSSQIGVSPSLEDAYFCILHEKD